MILEIYFWFNSVRNIVWTLSEFRFFSQPNFMKFYLSFDVSIYLFYLMEVPEEEQLEA